MNDMFGFLNPANWSGLKNGPVFVIGNLIDIYLFFSNMQDLLDRKELDNVKFWTLTLLYGIFFLVILITIFKFLVIIDTNATHKEIVLAKEQGTKKALDDFIKLQENK